MLSSTGILTISKVCYRRHMVAMTRTHLSIQPFLFSVGALANMNCNPNVAVHSSCIWMRPILDTHVYYHTQIQDHHEFKLLYFSKSLCYTLYD